MNNSHLQLPWLLICQVIDNSGISLEGLVWLLSQLFGPLVILYTAWQTTLKMCNAFHISHLFWQSHLTKNGFKLSRHCGPAQCQWTIVESINMN